MDEAVLRHKAFNGFIEYACSEDKVLDGYTFVYAMHAFLQQVVGFIGAHRVDTVAYAARFPEEP